MKLAAIDIGSNSIKLAVVEAASSDSFAVIAREKEVVRLGHDTLREGRLAPEAIERAAACIGSPVITKSRRRSAKRGTTRISVTGC